MKALSMTAVLLLFAAGCGGDSATGTSGANVVIVGVSAGGVNVQNIGGSGSFYIESWDQATYNAPGGDSPTLIRISSSTVREVAAGYSGTVGVTSGRRYVAKTRAGNTSDYFTSSCYGAC